MQTISSFGDMFEISATNEAYAPKIEKMNTQQLMTFFEENTHCSALIKVKPDLSDMFFAHTSWYSFVCSCFFPAHFLKKMLLFLELHD